MTGEHRRLFHIFGKWFYFRVSVLSKIIILKSLKNCLYKYLSPRISMMQSIALTAEKYDFCKFYHLIRIFYELATLFSDKKHCGKTVYLGRETPCIWYTPSNRTVKNFYGIDRDRPESSESPTSETESSAPLTRIDEEGQSRDEDSRKTGQRIEKPRVSASVHFVIHGGGFVYGSPDTVASFAESLMQKSGEDVIVIKYRLAPEYPYPESLIQIYEVRPVKWYFQINLNILFRKEY